jgi:hypothetical protein
MLLFFKEYTDMETCPMCKESQWKVVEKTCVTDSAADGATIVKKQLLVKVLHYFLLFLGCEECTCPSAH